MVRRVLLSILSVALFLPQLSGQEVVAGLFSNPQVKDSYLTGSTRAKSPGADTLELPFVDDFSDTKTLPNATRWEDANVFINNSFSNQQITSGVATFDAIDGAGNLYGNASSEGFQADVLTSRPINMDYPASEDIWLSFYYESGGLGDRPEEKDSLTLCFYAPDEEVWYHVWKDDSTNFQGYNHVMIHIDDERFLKRGFRFKFINYASLSSNLSDLAMLSNCDQWNIDYIILDKGRNQGDIQVTDVAFRWPNRSLLKTYESMPWKQFREIYMQEMGAAIPISYRNNDNITRNVTRQFEILDMYDNSNVELFSAGATNIEAFTNVDYDAYHYYTFNSTSQDSALFRVKSWLITDDFDRKENDTTIYYQSFSDYLSYDDGSSESGYGINGNGSANAMAALKFRAYAQDTIVAVRIFFNNSYRNSNDTEFDLVLWSDNNGLPGDILVEVPECTVRQGTATNGFYTYNLPTRLVVNSTFYVGWRQRSETFLNVGLDMNSDKKSDTFYHINGNWSASQIAGCVMIRPVFISPIMTAIDDTPYSERKDETIKLWPNPTRGLIYFERDNYFDSDIISVYDLNGREVIRTFFSEHIDLSSLKDGYYIVSISRLGRLLGTNRVVKVR